MQGEQGFTLIELIMFVVVTSILAATILVGFSNSLVKTPTLMQNMLAGQTARQCLEWFMGQRRTNGYTSFACNTTVPSFCTAPTGYTVSVNVACTTINSDANYKTITVTVSGNGNAQLSTLVANY